MSKTLCALPWIHLATRPNGDVRVCCTANASGAGDVDEKVIGLVKKNGISLNLRNKYKTRKKVSDTIIFISHILSGEAFRTGSACVNLLFTK